MADPWPPRDLSVVANTTRYSAVAPALQISWTVQHPRIAVTSRGGSNGDVSEPNCRIVRAKGSRQTAGGRTGRVTLLT